MLHDSVADDSYKRSPNKITRFLEELRLQHSNTSKIDPLIGCTNAHVDLVSIKAEDLDSYGDCDYYTHAGHKQPYNWQNNEEDYPAQDEQTKKIFNNMKIITIIPDCDVHPTRIEVSSDPFYSSDLYKFSPDHEIWYMKKYDIPNTYINYSEVINPDVNVLLAEILRIADLFKWPIVDNDTLLEYMKLYHDTVLHI